MAITRSKTSRIEAGVWRQWGRYFREKTAEQNIDTRQLYARRTRCR